MFKALIVDQFMESRVQIQRIIEHANDFNDCSSVHDLEEALSHLSKKIFEFVFISAGFAEEDIALFVEKSRKSLGGRNSTFILMVKPDQQDHLTVSNSMMVGIHGFLCQPFTISGLEEITRIARKVSNKNTKLRLRAATGLMLSNIVNEFGEQSNKAQTGKEDLWKQCQDSCETYKKVTGESVTSAVVDVIHKISPSKRVNSYDGASKRVRDLFQLKFKRHLRALAQKASPNKK